MLNMPAKQVKPAKHRQYTVIYEPQPDGGYTVTVPALPGCITEGDTFDEAKANAIEAIELYLESLTMDGEPIPEDISSQPISEKVTVELH